MNIIEEIIQHKRRPQGGGERLFPFLSFPSALKRDGLSIIAEIKVSSPSAGRLIRDRDPLSIAREYERAGGDALSVVTEERFFSGNLALLRKIKENVSIPVLRKDFLIFPEEIDESWREGADAVLLIATMLEKERLRELLERAKDRGISALVEVHDERELEKALEAGAEIIGVNNRNLKTLRVELGVSLRLIKLIPPHCIRVSESGISTPEEVRKLREAGFDAILVGTSLLRSPSPGEKLRYLKGGRGIQDENL